MKPLAEDASAHGFGGNSIRKLYSYKDGDFTSLWQGNGYVAPIFSRTTMRALLTSSGPGAAPTSAAAEIHYKIAENQRERAAAFRLCHDVYVQTGLMLPSRCQMRIMPHHLLATSAVFIAVQGSRVIATVSLIGDGQLGLPIECAYREEVAELRSPSRWLGEVSSLASDRGLSRRYPQLLGDLTRLMAQYAQRHGLEHLLAAVHPRHMGYYQGCLGFRSLSEVRPYPAVRGRPSVAVLLDLRHLQRQRHPSYLAYFRDRIPDEQLRYCPISGAERRFFSFAASHSRPLPLAAAHQDHGECAERQPQRASA